MAHIATKEDLFLYAEAFAEAQKGLREGGNPIGSLLVCDGKILGKGHNKRVQKGSAILHAEMDAIENAGRLCADIYKKCTLYTTLSPCSMCSGTILLYKIPRVVIGENTNFLGEEELLQSRGVKLVVLHHKETTDMMREFIKNNTQVWNEDIGE